jgi:hypothetical protein
LPRRGSATDSSWSCRSCDPQRVGPPGGGSRIDQNQLRHRENEGRMLVDFLRRLNELRNSE